MDGDWSTTPTKKKVGGPSQTNNDDNKPATATATATLSPTALAASNSPFVKANNVGVISATRNPPSFTFAGGFIRLEGNNNNGGSGIGGKSKIMFKSTANNNAAFGASSFGKTKPLTAMAVTPTTTQLLLPPVDPARGLAL